MINSRIKAENLYTDLMVNCEERYNMFIVDTSMHTQMLS